MSEYIFFKLIVYGFKSFLIGSIYIFIVVVGMLVSIFMGGFLFDMLNGLVGIYYNVDLVVKVGIISLIGYIVLLSVNLGIMNLIFIFVLDGGCILFVIYEVIFRKLVNKKVEIMIIVIGVIFMVVIMILVMWNDIWWYFL